VERFLDTERIFALVASFTAGADAELAELAAEREVPLVGPLTLDVDDTFPMNRQVFHLYAGLTGQARALVRDAAARRARRPTDPGSRALILHADDPLLAAAADAAADEAATAGWTGLDRRSYPAATLEAAAEIRRWSDGGIDDVFLLVPGEAAAALVASATASGWRGTVHVPGPLAAASLHSGGTAGGPGIVLAFPTLPRDRHPDALGQLHDALGRSAAGGGDGGGDGDDVGGEDGDEGAAGVAAWVALELLTRALERVGRDVSRESLITALEDLREFPTGLTPPLTYGPNRRVGSRGSWVVEMPATGTAAAPRAEWVALN
jgi:ABC-type branched-subunit amino acid transport system substrate-binding protein